MTSTTVPGDVQIASTLSLDTSATAPVAASTEGIFVPAGAPSPAPVSSSDLAIASYFNRNPIEWGFGGPDMTQDAACFIEAFNAGGMIAIVIEADPWIIRGGLSADGGSTIARMQDRFRHAVGDRRAFYLAVRAFVNDPATWEQLDAQDAAPDFAAYAAILRAEGIPVHEDGNGENDRAAMRLARQRLSSYNEQMLKDKRAENLAKAGGDRSKL